jgi:hypothetical protein
VWQLTNVSPTAAVEHVNTILRTELRYQREALEDNVTNLPVLLRVGNFLTGWVIVGSTHLFQ